MLKRLFGSGLIGPAAIYLGATILSSAIPFLLLPFLTRWLGPAEFGIVGAFLAAVGMLGAVIGLSTHGLISVVYYRDGPDAMPVQVAAAVCVAGLSTLGWALLFWLASGRLAAMTGVPESWLWTIPVAGVGQFLVSILLATFQTVKRPILFGAIQFGFALVLAGLSIWLIGTRGLGWEGRALAQVIAGALVIVPGFMLLTRMKLIVWRVDGDALRGALSFGLPLLPHAVSVMVMASVDRFALSSTLGSEQVGYYVAAFQIAMVLSVLATAFNQAWLPWLYERLARNEAMTDRQVVRATWAMISLFALGAAGLALLAGWIIPLVAGPQFSTSIPLLRILAPAAACSAAYFFFAAFLFYARRTGTLSLVSATTAIIQTGLSFWLVQGWGSIGVAWATLAGAFIYACATGLAAHHVHPMPWFGGPHQDRD